MKEKTIDCAAETIKEIKAEVQNGVIKDHLISSLCNMSTSQNTGFVVELNLSGKFEYTNDVLDDWKNRFSADSYSIKIRSNSLYVRYRVHFDDENKA